MKRKALSNRALAKKIAKELFTGGFETKATRLELKLGVTIEREIALGGWSENAAIDAIEDVIKRFTVVPRPTSTR